MSLVSSTRSKENRFLGFCYCKVHALFLPMRLRGCRRTSGSDGLVCRLSHVWQAQKAVDWQERAFKAIIS